jgi:hypothetical protein
MQKVTKNILKFTATGLVAGVVLGCLLSLPSGNYFVTLGVATLGLFVGRFSELFIETMLNGSSVDDKSRLHS